MSLTANKGGGPAFPNDNFRRGGTKLLSYQRQHQFDNINYPFRFYRINANEIAMNPGTVNERYVTMAGGTNDDPLSPTIVGVSGGTTYYYLDCFIETDPNSDDFGDLAANAGANINAYPARQTSLAEWNRPYICIARVEATALPNADGYNIAIFNEVFSSLQLIQFFDRYIFMPYFVPADLVASQGT
jgi:hypothetical protein